MPDDYKFNIAECDVVDTSSLDAFRRKRAEWRNHLDEDDEHAIWQTIQAMVWREVSFSTIAQVAETTAGGALNNTLVAEAILHGHFAMQVMAVRTLVDRSTKGVISLARLVQDVRTNRKLLTRENLVCYDGLPYDYERVRDEEWKRLGGGVHWGEKAGPRAYGVSQLAHARFDKLSGVTPESRSRGDLPKAAVFERMDQWLEDCGAAQISKWSHTYLAHAGSAASRQALGDYSLTGNRVKAAIQGLARVAEAVSSTVLNVGGRMHALTPTAQFDQFACLTKPAMRPEGLDAAQARWTEETNRYDALLSDVDDKLLTD